MYEPRHKISNNVVCAYAQADQSLCWSLEYFMTVKLLTEHHLEFLSLKGGFTGSSECALVKMSHCCKSHAMAHYYEIKPFIREASRFFFITPQRYIILWETHWIQ